MSEISTRPGVAIEPALYKEERRVLRFLESERPDLIGLFLAAVPRARRDTLKLLVSAMLREDVDGARSGARGAGETSRVLPLPGGERLTIPITGLYAFGRLEVGEPILRVVRGESERIGSAAQFLRLFRRRTTSAFAGKAWRSFERELGNGGANLALARAHHEERKDQLRELAAGYGAEGISDLALALKERTPEFDELLFFERLCIEGHNLHPCARTRMGIEPEDVYRYAAEFDGEPGLRLVGVRRDRVESASVGGGDVGEVLLKHYPGLREAAGDRLREKECRPADYVLVPVHPWQAENVVGEVYRDEIDAGIVVPVEGVSLPASATASFRTVISGRAGRLAVKTSVDSQMTSTVRSISPNTAINAARFTRLIREVLRREPGLAPAFTPVCELAGVSFRVSPDEPDPAVRTAKARNLSAVVREDAGRYVGRGELAIAGCALYAESPLSGRPIVAELVEAYARSVGGGPREAAARFVSEYARVVLPGFLTLLVKYGIGLEGHLQNCIPVFREGRPVRLLFRDWAGSRLYDRRLARRALATGFYPGSVILTGDLEETRSKVFYTVFQNHLGEVLLQLCKEFGVPEKNLWREVRRVCDEIFEGLRPECAGDAASDREALYAAEVRHKALATMRLAPGGYRYARVPNPLSNSG